MKRALPIALLVLLVALALSVPASAQANVQVLDAEGTELASFSSAACRKGGKRLLSFTAQAKSRGWKLSVNIFRGLRNKDIGYGGDGDVDFTVSGPGGSFTNLNRPPNGVAVGAVRFNAKRTRMAIGFAAAFNGEFSQTVGVGGGLKCIYPKKKKKRRR